MFRAITIPAAFAALLLSGFFCRAQHAFRFADSTAVWKFCEWYYLFPSGATGGLNTYVIQGDTSIDNLDYQKILDNSRWLYHLRRDSNNKIFFYDSWIWEEDEWLVYDFGLEVGDTFKSYYTPQYGPPSLRLTMIVDSTDTITIGIPRKRMFMRCDSSNTHCFDVIWIDGIGSLNSHFANPLGFEFEPEGSRYSIFSFEENGIIHHFDSSCIVTVSEISIDPIKIYPNPASNHLYAEGVKHPATFHLYDIAGKEVLSTPLLTGTNRIEITNLADGVYFYKIGSGQQMGKVVIENRTR